jgi:hypothetical protein
MVRSGERASSRNTAVASKPMNPVRENSTATLMPGVKTFSGANELSTGPSAPPEEKTTTSRMTMTVISSTSATPRTRAPSSMCR